MTLLLREPEVKADPAPEASPAAPAAERVCDTCGAAMAPDQDWCLTCGTAAPGRLGTRPGLRAAATAVGLTLLLAGGAVAASYAALSSDAHREAASPAPPDATPVAQVPATPAAAPATGTAPPSTATPAAPAVAPPTIAPGTTAPSGSPHVTVPPVGTPAPTTPLKITPSTPTPTTTHTPTTTSPTTTHTPTSTRPQPIALGADAVDIYDPYKRAEDKGDPADAYDNSTDSAWRVSTPLRSKEMGVGLVVDLETARSVKVVKLLTDTPGFRIELYAANGNDLPPDVLDTRWAHVKNRSRVDETKRDGSPAGDGEERIVLGAGTAKYRYVLLWFTTPPDDGPTVEIADLKLLG